MTFKLLSLFKGAETHTSGLNLQDYEFLKSVSPINFVNKISAPLMVIHGANDPRVPLSEAQQIVNSLNSQGKKTKLLVYGDEGHGLSKLKNRLDAYPQVIDFLNKIIIEK